MRFALPLVLLSSVAFADVVPLPPEARKEMFNTVGAEAQHDALTKAAPEAAQGCVARAKARYSQCRGNVPKRYGDLGAVSTQIFTDEKRWLSFIAQDARISSSLQICASEQVADMLECQALNQGAPAQATSPATVPTTATAAKP